jgi:hypothetical protein
MFVEQVKHIYTTPSKTITDATALTFDAASTTKSREMRVTMSAMMCINDDQGPRPRTLCGNKLILTRSESSVITIDATCALCVYALCADKKRANKKLALKKRVR